MTIDENQLELVEGEIVPTRQLTYLSEAQLAQKRAAGKASAMALYNNTNRVDYIAKVAEIGRRTQLAGCTPENMLNAFHEYLEMSAREGQRIGNLTAYMAIGASRQMIEQWMSGRRHADDPRYKQLANYIKTVCAAHREQMALNNEVHPALSIFWQRNFDGLTNEDVIRVEPSDLFGEIKDTEEIKERYKDLTEE